MCLYMDYTRCKCKRFVYILLCTSLTVVLIFVFLEDKENADLWLLNSCTVKSPAEDHFRNEIKLAQKLDKYIVVAGCVPQGQPKADYMQVKEF